MANEGGIAQGEPAQNAPAHERRAVLLRHLAEGCRRPEPSRPGVVGVGVVEAVEGTVEATEVVPSSEAFASEGRGENALPVQTAVTDGRCACPEAGQGRRHVGGPAASRNVRRHANQLRKGPRQPPPQPPDAGAAELPTGVARHSQLEPLAPIQVAVAQELLVLRLNGVAPSQAEGSQASACSRAVHPIQLVEVVAVEPSDYARAQHGAIHGVVAETGKEDPPVVLEVLPHIGIEDRVDEGVARKSPALLRLLLPRRSVNGRHLPRPRHGDTDLAKAEVEAAAGVRQGRRTPHLDGLDLARRHVNPSRGFALEGAREPAPHEAHVDRHLHRGLDHRDHRATVGLLDCSQPMRRAE